MLLSLHLSSILEDPFLGVLSNYRVPVKAPFHIQAFRINERGKVNQGYLFCYDRVFVSRHDVASIIYPESLQSLCFFLIREVKILLEELEQRKEKTIFSAAQR